LAKKLGKNPSYLRRELLRGTQGKCSKRNALGTPKGLNGNPNLRRLKHGKFKPETHGLGK